LTDTTYIDVLDTAVKVGLGALIGFGGTLILESVRSIRDKRNLAHESRKELLIKTAEFLDSGMNSAAHCSQAFKNRLQSSDFSAVDKELEANNFLGKAETYATLASCPDLAKKIKALKEKFLSCYGRMEPPVTLTRNQMNDLNGLADEAYRSLARHFSEL